MDTSQLKKQLHDLPKCLNETMKLEQKHAFYKKKHRKLKNIKKKLSKMDA